MSEIRVEEKKNRSIWPWIIGLLALVAVVWAIAEIGDEDDYENEVAATEEYMDTERQEVSNEIEVYENEAVEEFVDFTRTEGEMGLDHVYTSNGIMKLNAALEALADDATVGTTSIESKREMMREAANSIEKDPMAATHANSIRDAFMASANLLEAIQQNNYPNYASEVQELKQAAMDIDPDVLTLNQKEAVKNYFDKAAQVLNHMTI